jgi:hypothetical protein
MTESKFKKLECLFAWNDFYANSKNLAVPTNQEKEKLYKVQKEINKLKKELID